MPVRLDLLCKLAKGVAVGVHELAGILHGLCKLRIVWCEAQAPVRLAHGEELIALLHAHLLEKALRQDDAAGVSNLADLESVRHNRTEVGYEGAIITVVITTDSIRIGFVALFVAMGFL